jgi:recA bacterial DNA recombination protein
MTGILRTGSISLDVSLFGGWRRGGIVDIQGTEGTGKTTILQHAVKNLDKGEEALWVSLGTGIPARNPGFAVAQPRSAEEAFVIMIEALNIGASLVVVDSADGLVRYEELLDPGYVPDTHREFKPELDHLRKACRRTNGLVMFVSRPRANSPGLRGTGISEKAHQKVRLKLVELRQSGRRRITTTGGADFWIDPGTGIDWAEDLLRTAYETGLAYTEGSWWYVNSSEKMKFFGLESAKEYLRNNPELSRKLADEVVQEARKSTNG